jgi:hypothetical protein
MKFFASVFLAFSLPLSVYSEIEARVDERVNEDVKPARLEFKFVFWENGHPLQECLLITPAVKDPKSYEIVGTKNDKPVSLTIESVTAPGEQFCSKVILHQKAGETIDSGVEYHARVKDRSIWKFRGGQTSFHYANRNGDRIEDYASSDIVAQGLNEEWLTKAFVYQKKISLQSSDKAAVVSLQWHFVTHDSPADLMNYAIWRFEILGKADFTLPAKEKTDYLNHLSAEGNYFWSNRWGKSGDSFRVYVDFGVHGGLESDQTFDNVDDLGGVLLRATIGNPLTDMLHKIFLKQDEPVVSPFFSVGYNYVDHIKEGNDLDNGNNRIDASFFWRWPLARGIDVPKTLGLIDEVFDADLLIELGGNYDLDRERFADLSKVTLDIEPRTHRDKYPSITVTYANGKASPTFRHFDAFLAGFKYKF